MKKTLIAAAVMAASGVAFAASNVTLYGVLEEGVVVIWHQLWFGMESWCHYPDVWLSVCLAGRWR